MDDNARSEQEVFSQNIVCLYSRTSQRNTTQLLELLPVELLDMILRKSYLLGVLNKSEFIRQKDKDIMCALASVKYSWFQWIRTGKFKRSISRHLKVYYDEAKKTATIIRNNRNFLKENIQTTEEFLALLLSIHCLKEEEALFINRLHLDKDKNHEILRIIGSADEAGSRSFIGYLRKTKQRKVARVVEMGGVVLKAKLRRFGAKENQESLEKLNDILTNNMENNPKTKRLIFQLKSENISILLSSVEKGNGIILWIWCRSQDSLEKLQEMYVSNRLLEILKDVFSSFPSGLNFSKKMKLSIDDSYFETNVSVRSMASCSFAAKLEMEGNPDVRGVTKLWNQIYVLCKSWVDSSSWIIMFEDENPFPLQKKIEMNETKNPDDIVSCEMENCLYVSGYDENERKKCIWKIMESGDRDHQVSKWLMDIKSTNELTLSVSSDGQLLTSVRYGQSWSLLIYGPNAELRRSISFPREEFSHNYIFHAIETSKGSFIICHDWTERKQNEGKIKENEKEGKKGQEEEELEEKKEMTKSDGNELTRDGKSIIGRFTEKNVSKGNIEEGEEDKTQDQEKEQAEEGKDEDKEEEDKQKKNDIIYMHIVSEVTRGGSVIRRFIPKDENQELDQPQYLYLDSDDRLILADHYNNRVILFDSDLKWNRILIPTEEDIKNGRRISWPMRLCYHEEKNQLIIGGIKDVYVYSFNWK